MSREFFTTTSLQASARAFSLSNSFHRAFHFTPFFPGCWIDARRGGRKEQENVSRLSRHCVRACNEVLIFHNFFFFLSFPRSLIFRIIFCALCTGTYIRTLLKRSFRTHINCDCGKCCWLFESKILMSKFHGDFHGFYGEWGLKQDVKKSFCVLQLPYKRWEKPCQMLVALNDRGRGGWLPHIQTRSPLPWYWRVCNSIV